MSGRDVRIRNGKYLLILPVVIFSIVSLLPVAFQIGKTILESDFGNDRNSVLSANKESFTISAPRLTPWASIGGCGAGGSGGAAGNSDGIKWIGTESGGGLIDLELLPKYQLGQNFKSFTIAPHISFKPTWTTTVGVIIPVMSKTGEVQYLTHQEPFDVTTGGLGDISFDFTKVFGMSGQYSLELCLSLPIGQYDIKRGTESSLCFLPKEFQKGSGIYNSALTLSRTVDVEDGMWLVYASVNYPFNAKFSGENEMLDKYFQNYKDRKSNRRFYYRFKPYGENDLGGYTPPSGSVSVYYSYRGISQYIHTWGINFSAPFGVAWIPYYKVNTYDPGPDPNNEVWNAAFMYGLEFSRPKYPIFLAASLPLHDKRNPLGRWDGPDWGDFLQQWTFAVGIKASMF